MKKLLLAAASLLALGMAAPASAADLAVKAAPPPIMAPIYNWTGFYIGANGGWGSAHNCWDFVTAAGAVFHNDCVNRSGGLIGGQLGYRWQVNQFVFGLEAQGDWANLSSSRVSLFNPGNCALGVNCLSTRTQLNGIGLFTGQIGYAWNAALLYVKGGAGVTGSRFDILDTASGITLASASSTRWGGTVGVGFEYGFAPNWSVGAEYDHIWTGNANNTFNGINAMVATIVNNRISQDVDMFTLRVNYRFGSYAAPIAARY